MNATSTISTVVLLLSVVLSASACAPAPQRMKDALAEQKCTRAARIGNKWLTEALPKRLKSAASSPKSLRKTAKLHAQVVGQMLDALHCAATQRNTIAALKSFRAVSSKLVAPVAAALQPPLLAQKKRLDAESLGQEATIHFFQHARPRGTAAAFAEHRRLYPSSRYIKDALKSELQMALHEAYQRPTWKTTSAFAKNYADVAGGRERIADLWRKTAMAEFKALARMQQQTVGDFIRWFTRYAERVPKGDLETVANYTRTVVTSRVNELSKSTDVRELLAFINATRDIKLPMMLTDLQRALQLRHLVVHRRLLDLTWKHALKRGSSEAYEGFLAMWSEDPVAADQVQQVKAALAMRGAWLELGSQPTVMNIRDFLEEHGPNMNSEAMERLDGCPTISKALRRGRQIGTGDECALKGLVQTCLDAKWCDMKNPAVVSVVNELARAVSRANRGKSGNSRCR